MKRMISILLLLSAFIVSAQQKPQHLPSQLKNIGLSRSETKDNPSLLQQAIESPSTQKLLLPSEANIGETRFDLQTNLSLQNRIYRFEDGTVGASWTMGFSGGEYPERGTAYNYFDGTSWGPEPSTRIESVRTGWPSYVPVGAEGEAVIAHSANGYLVMNKRSTKGSGSWAQTFFNAPAGHGLYWPRMVSSGSQKNTLHLLAVTEPTNQGGTSYLGLDGALLYSRSTDGGQSWEIKDSILPGLTSAEYRGFDGDMYTWAEPKGDTIAFVVSDYWLDMILMKSTNGGDSWSKTIIWENPYPFFDKSNPIVTDTFYCPDGSIHLAFDKDGLVHIVFGVNRAHADGVENFWFPFIDGVGYWNETMPAFVSPNFKYTMQPDTLYNHGNLIGWTQDINENDSLDFLPGSIEILGKYYISLSSMPQLLIDENEDMFLIYSSVTEGYDNGIQNFRHLWGRALFHDNTDWSGFVHLTGSIVHNFDECVFPSLAPLSDNNLYFIYHADEEPGLSVSGDEDAPTDNRVVFSSTPKTDFGVGMDEPASLPGSAGEFFPNPTNGESQVSLFLNAKANITIKVYSLSGQLVKEYNQGMISAGQHLLSIDVHTLPSGMYFCGIIINEQEISRKLIKK